MMSEDCGPAHSCEMPHAISHECCAGVENVFSHHCSKKKKKSDNLGFMGHLEIIFGFLNDANANASRSQNMHGEIFFIQDRSPSYLNFFCKLQGKK